MKLCTKRSDQYLDLAPALLYTNAYITDDNGIIIIVDTDYAATVIHKYKDIILECAKKSDSVEYPYLEVIVANDL